ncbi:hypothetical protein Tco_0375520 [Tanacetum coccineum]
MAQIDLFRCRPFCGLLQIGFMSQGYREPGQTVFAWTITYLIAIHPKGVFTGYSLYKLLHSRLGYVSCPVSGASTLHKPTKTSVEDDSNRFTRSRGPLMLRCTIAELHTAMRDTNHQITCLAEAPEQAPTLLFPYLCSVVFTLEFFQYDDEDPEEDQPTIWLKRDDDDDDECRGGGAFSSADLSLMLIQ